jgi:hypothetical protein
MEDRPDLAGDPERQADRGRRGVKHPEESRYIRDFVRMQGLRILRRQRPLTAPVFEGYPGAVHVYRTEDQGAFSQGDFEQAGELRAAARCADREDAGDASEDGTSTVDVSIVGGPRRSSSLFNGELRELFAGSEFENIDRPHAR